MRQQGTAPRLAPSRDGVLFVSGFATSLQVERGHLLVRTGSGRRIREARLSKVGRPRIRRLVVFGKGGFTTFEALAWLHGVGASFCHLSRSGEILAMSAHTGPDQPALRRAQVLAGDSPAGLEVVRHLLRAKLQGQLSVLREHFVYGSGPIDAVSLALAKLEDEPSARKALAWEAKAASAYWRAWSPEPIRFARADEGKIPEHWPTFGDRHSALTYSPRLATTPASALLNYLYALAEFECRLGLVAMGLDPGLGWAHRDAPYRDSAALDVLEAVRPRVDEWLLRLLRERTFTRREFVEAPTGQVRLMPALARMLAESALPQIERSSGPIVEEVARLLAGSAPLPIVVRTRLTQADRKRGRTRARGLEPPKMASACRNCGLVLEDPERAYCDECLPAFAAERTERLRRAGADAIRRMRGSPDDPAKTPEARAKQAASSTRHAKARRAWEREHGREVDAQRYEREILPRIRAMTVPALVGATGLSSYYCWEIRSGRKRLHERHWDALHKSASSSHAPFEA